MEHMTLTNGHSLSINSAGDLFLNIAEVEHMTLTNGHSFPFTSDVQTIFICSAKDRRRTLVSLKYATEHFLNHA